MKLFFALAAMVAWGAVAYVQRLFFSAIVGENSLLLGLASLVMMIIAGWLTWKNVQVWLFDKRGGL
jgi:hypothetical protein